MDTINLYDHIETSPVVTAGRYFTKAATRRYLHEGQIVRPRSIVAVASRANIPTLAQSGSGA